MENTRFDCSLKNLELNIECVDHDKFFKMEETHYHDSYEIYYQVYGDRYLMTNGNFIHVKQGNLIWIKKFDLHQSFQGEMPVGNRVVIYFTENFIRKVFRENTDRLLKFFSDVFQVVSLDSIQQKKVLELMYEIECGLHNGQDLYVQFVFGQLILLLESWMCNQLVGTVESAYIDAKHDRISKVLAYLKNHCDEKIRLDEVAQIFHVTPHYLSRSFKECTGISFVNYINHLKIEQAKERLRDNHSIMQVSLDLGYESITHFERVFKKVTGTSPTAWKKQKMK